MSAAPTERHLAIAALLREPVPPPPPPKAKPPKATKIWQGLHLGRCYLWQQHPQHKLWEVVATSTQWAHVVPLGQTWPRLVLDETEAAQLAPARRPPQRKEKLRGKQSA